jgi:hypothetical protein
MNSGGADSTRALPWLVPEIEIWERRIQAGRVGGLLLRHARDFRRIQPSLGAHFVPLGFAGCSVEKADLVGQQFGAVPERCCPSLQ